MNLEKLPCSYETWSWKNLQVRKGLMSTVNVLFPAIALMLHSSSWIMKKWHNLRYRMAFITVIFCKWFNMLEKLYLFMLLDIDSVLVCFFQSLMPYISLWGKTYLTTTIQQVQFRLTVTGQSSCLFFHMSHVISEMLLTGFYWSFGKYGSKRSNRYFPAFWKMQWLPHRGSTVTAENKKTFDSTWPRGGLPGVWLVYCGHVSFTNMQKTVF